MNTPEDFFDELKKHSDPKATEFATIIIYGLARAIQAKTTAEIGIFGGHVTVPLAHAMKRHGGKHYAIEIDETRIGRTRSLIRRDNLVDYCEFICGDSQYITFNHKLDLLFVDGDHGENKVINEVKKYWSLINKNGFMIFHDSIQYDSVSRALNGSSVKSEREQAQVLEIKTPPGLTIWKKI